MRSEWALAALAFAGCAPVVTMSARDAEVPVLVGRAPSAGERVSLVVGRMPPKRRERDLPDVEPLFAPRNEEQLREQLQNAVRNCPSCAVYVVWMKAELTWVVLLGDSSSVIRAPGVVLESGEGAQ